MPYGTGGPTSGATEHDYYGGYGGGQASTGFAGPRQGWGGGYGSVAQTPQPRTDKFAGMGAFMPGQNFVPTQASYNAPGMTNGRGAQYVGSESLRTNQIDRGPPSDTGVRPGRFSGPNAVQQARMGLGGTAMPLRPPAYEPPPGSMGAALAGYGGSGGNPATGPAGPMGGPLGLGGTPASETAQMQSRMNFPPPGQPRRPIKVIAKQPTSFNGANGDQAQAY